MRKIYILFIFLFFSVGAFAQTQKAYIKAAEEAYNSKSYYSAMVYYQEAVAFDTSDLNLRYQLAESARNFMSYDLAEQSYEFVKNRDTDNNFPLTTFYLAEMLQKQGKYEKAKEEYDLYLSENSGDDEFYTYKADKEREASEWALTEIESPDETITVNSLGNDINTTYSDFGPAINGSELFYSSMKFIDPNNKTERISKILKTEIPEDLESSFSGGEELGDEINMASKNTANAAFNKDKSKMFYTVCDRLNDAEIRCDLYCKVVNADGTYGEGKKLPDFINSADNTSTHPSVGYNASLDKEILYFVSDREGGKGKLDIWYSIIDNKDNFTAPQNLEALNTKEDEVTPFFHINSSTLYFSSNGYRSFGGFDVYNSSFNNGEYGDVNHLNNPLNTSYHDLYFVLQDDEEYGYFASNREGAQYIDELQEACCFDLYKVKFENLELDLNALTYDKFSQGDLEGATVKLINEKTGELIGEITNADGIDHKFKLDRCTDYIIVGEKAGYISDTIRYSTCGLKKSQEIIKKLYLEPDVLELDVFTFDDATKEALNGATVTLTDLSDPSAEPIVITNFDGNDYNYKIIRGNKYKIDVSKPGYYPTSVDVITENIAGTKITKNIYLRADSVAKLGLYLPVNLYFHNDRPNPRTTSTTTTLTYTQTYFKYKDRKAEYVRRAPDANSISNFFDNDVTGGYNSFMTFLREVQPVLARGESIEIVIKGHASPLSQTNYNLYLGQRRIASVINDIRAYGGGVLIPYIDSGQLKVTDISYGENLSPVGISDSYTDKKRSIYSTEASRERRVEIIDVTRQQN